jgi:tetratricopeptide (TPR) repeat protein
MAQPQRTDSKGVAPLLAEAFASHQAGRLEEAERIYAQIVVLAPGHFDALHLRGLILHQRGDHAGALAQIDAALRTIPDNLLALNNRGLVLNALGRFDDALASYARALALRPDFPEALLNRGNTLQDLKRYEAAVASYDRALAARPDYAEAHYNHGNALNALKRFSEALASYDRALALQSDDANVLSNRGMTLHALKRFDEALASYDRALVLQPQFAAAHSHRGATLKALKRFDEALASYDQALALTPDYAEALTNRGVSLNALERFDEALASYSRALELEPDDADAHSNRGVTLHQLKRFEAALASCDRALASRPDYAEAHSNRGNALHGLGRFEEAVASYECALALRPDYAEALANRGLALHEQRRFEEALASYDRALALRPEYAEALLNRGVTLQELKRFEEALACYDGALKVRSNFAQAHYNEAICRLLIGDFARGWEKYEWRWQEELATAKRNFSQPLWTGSNDIAGKTILLHAEQGLGDTLQFCRYVPFVARLASRVILEVQKPLHEMMSSLDGAPQIVSRGDPLPAFDIHCPLLSLPRALKTQLETIPSEISYLSAPESKVKAWRDRLGDRQRARIGIVWAGNPRKELSARHRILDQQRSIEFNRLKPIFQEPNCDFYSLQKGDDAVLQLRDSPLRHSIIDLTDHLHDFSDTAALIENLDLVISVDTAVAHLSGALGKPFWLLNRDNTCWRWLLNREDSPWYPTGRLFRQDQTRDWDNVVARVQAALHDYVRSLPIT